MLKTYSGFVHIRDCGDSMDVLFLEDEKYDSDEPLAEILQDDIAGRQVTVQYWIADQKCTKEEAQEAFIQRLFGAVDCKFYVAYSDITGYLWTDEWINIGGHDLLAELSSNEGKYVILEVEVHD